MDPVADFLIIIKNGYMAKKDEVLVPYSNFKHEIAKILEKENFIGKVSKEDSKMKIELLYEAGSPKIGEIKKVSKLGLRVYTKSKNIKKVKGGRGLTIVSTPKGLMTGYEARKKKLGGEVICIVS